MSEKNISVQEFYQAVPVGTRVLVCGSHDWAGHTGVFVGLEQTPWGLRPRIQLDNGCETFIFDPSHWRPANQ